jgi:MFS family permease
MFRTLKSIYLGLGKSSVIYPSAFLVATSISIVELGVVFYLREEFGAASSQVGYFIATWSGTYIIGCLFIRPLFNRILARYLLIASSLCMSLFVVSVDFTDSLRIAFVLYNLYGFSMAFFWPPIMGWLSRDVEGDRLGKSMSYFNLSWGSGLIIGPLLAGILSELSPRLPLYAGGLLFFTTGMLITTASITIPAIRTDRGTDERGRRSRKRDGSTPLRFPGWVGVFTTFVIIGMIISVFPVYAREELLIRKQTIGLLMQSRTFIATFVFIFLAHTSFWHFRIVPMVAGQLCLGAAVLLLTRASSPMLLAGTISMIGALRALSYNVGIFHGVSGSENRANRMASHEALLAAGLIVGSSLGGIVYEHYSMDAVYGSCASIVILGAFIQLGLYLLLRRERPRAAAQ